MRRRRVLLTGTALSWLAWGVVEARLTFGAVPDRLTIIFDGTCDFCTRVVRAINALDRRKGLTTLPFQQPGLPEAVGLTYAQCEQTVWVITPDGVTYGTAGAVNLILAFLLGAPLPLWLYAMPGIRQVQERAYRWVAANRHRFPGDKPYCEQFPEACGKGAAE